MTYFFNLNRRPIEKKVILIWKKKERQRREHKKSENVAPPLNFFWCIGIRRVFVSQHKYKNPRNTSIQDLRYFLLQDYLHFTGKWWIMVFTTFRVYKRFRILFVHIFVLLGFPWSPLTESFRFTYVNSAGRSPVILILHNFSLWAFFSPPYMCRLFGPSEGRTNEIKICTKRIRNLS